MEVDGGENIVKFYDLKTKQKQEDNSWPFIATSCSLTGLVLEHQVARYPTKSILTFVPLSKLTSQPLFTTSFGLSWYLGGVCT